MGLCLYNGIAGHSSQPPHARQTAPNYDVWITAVEGTKPAVRSYTDWDTLVGGFRCIVGGNVGARGNSIVCVVIKFAANITHALCYGVRFTCCHSLRLCERYTCPVLQFKTIRHHPVLGRGALQSRALLQREPHQGIPVSPCKQRWRVFHAAVLHHTGRERERERERERGGFP